MQKTIIGPANSSGHNKTDRNRDEARIVYAPLRDHPEWVGVQSV